MDNILFEPGFCQSVVVTDPASPSSGDPVRYGNMTGVASTTIAQGGNDATHTTVNFGFFICQIPVTATAGAIAAGDPLWYNDAIDGVDNTSSGCPFGMALEIVASATHTIKVFHVPYPGGFALGAGTVGVSQLAANALAASAPGRGKMQDGFFDVATVLAKFAANSFTTANMLSLFNTDAITNAVLLQAILDGAFQADANTLALFADGIWTGAKLADPGPITKDACRTAHFVWDFATDAHAVGTVPFRGAALPAKARIVSGHCWVKTALTGGASASAAIQVTGANDIVAAAVVTGVPWSIADAMIPIVPVNTTATCVKSESASGRPSLVIGATDLTAGNIELWLNYVCHL